MTTKKDITYKILFAIQLAMLPMVFFSNIYLTDYALTIFIGLILLARLGMEFLKDDKDFKQQVIASIGDVAVMLTLCLFFLINKSEVLNLGLTIFALVLFVLMNCFKLLFSKKVMPEFVNAVDACFYLFYFLFVMALMFVLYYKLIALVLIIAICLTGFVSVSYKIFYAFKYTNMVKNIKIFFKKLFRKRK